MNISNLVCWQTAILDGKEHICFTEEQWMIVPDSYKRIEDGLLLCRTPFNRHWLLGIDYLPVQLLSLREIELLKFNSKAELRKLSQPLIEIYNDT